MFENKQRIAKMKEMYQLFMQMEKENKEAGGDNAAAMDEMRLMLNEK